MKPPTVKPITKEELYAYLKYVNEDAPDSGWPQEQADLIASVLVEQGMIQGLIEKMRTTAPADFSIIDSYLSMVIWGFQCGREFEVRQMVKAMRKVE